MFSFSLIIPLNAPQMPKRAKSKEMAVKRMRVPRAFPRGTSMGLPALGETGGAPAALRTKLTFCGIKSVQGVTGGSVTYWAFKANSLFDPDPTVGGAQPNSFDQIMTLYTDWRCYGSKIRITCVPAGIDLNVGPLTFNVFPYRATSVTPPSAGQLEQISTWPNSKELICTPRGGSQDIGYLKHKMTNKSFFAHQASNTASFQGSATADCPQPFYWIVSMYNTNQVSVAQTYSGGISVMITFDVEFFSPRQNNDV